MRAALLGDGGKSEEKLGGNTDDGDVDMGDSGVSGVSRVWGYVKTVYGEALAREDGLDYFLNVLGW